MGKECQETDDTRALCGSWYAMHSRILGMN